MKHKLLLLLFWLSSSIYAVDICYVSQTGSHTIPFDSETTAATNIQDAVDQVASTGTVIIAGGTYTLLQEITVSKEVEIRAADGEQVTVDGNGITPCFSLHDIPCILNGLIIVNGYNDSINGKEGGGVSCPGNKAVLTNCVIRDCEADFGGGVAGTTAYFCVVRDNRAGFGGGGERLIAHSCMIYNNVADYDGGGLDLSEVYNSLIHSNATVLPADEGAVGGGGVSFDSKVVNCTVVNNHSAGEAGGIEGGLVLNSIVANNTSASGIDMNFNDSAVFSNSCSPELTMGESGNTTVLPDFVDAGAGNYRLLIGSSGINEANNAYMVGSVDCDGNKRRVGGIVDMGAYENQFDPFDLDKDELPDSWEIEHFGNTNALPMDHGDTDIFNNLQEFIAGTDPMDAQSYFALSNSTANGYMLHWFSLSNRLYNVYWTTNLSDGFHPLEEDLEYPRNSLTNSTDGPAFYKVDVRLK